eukprot:60669_1
MGDTMGDEWRPGYTITIALVFNKKCIKTSAIRFIMTSELASKHSSNKPVTPPNNQLIIPQREASNPTIVSLLEPNKGLKKATHDWDAECKPPIGSGECFSTLPAPFCY